MPGLGFDSDWIVKRTGILERRHAAPDQATSDLCVLSSQRLLRQNRNRNRRIVIYSFSGRSRRTCRFPSTACLVQDRLGMVGPAIEVEAACAGLHVRAHHSRQRTFSAGRAIGRWSLAAMSTLKSVSIPDDIKTYPLFRRRCWVRSFLNEVTRIRALSLIAWVRMASGGPLLHAGGVR